MCLPLFKVMYQFRFMFVSGLNLIAAIPQTFLTFFQINNYPQSFNAMTHSAHFPMCIIDKNVDESVDDMFPDNNWDKLKI